MEPGAELDGQAAATAILPPAFPYQGSKRRLAPTLLRCLPADLTRLIEPFAGSAAISLAVAARLPRVELILNDRDAALMALWHAILSCPEQLAAAYADLWERQRGQERAFFDTVRAEFNRTPRPDRLLYLLARCVKASVRYNARGEFNQSPDNRRRGMQPARMQRNLLAAWAYLGGRAELSSNDYRDVLARAEPSDVIYLDPPYQGVCSGRDPRYLEGIEFESFVDALDDLNRRGIRYLVSYDGRTGEKAFGRVLPDSLGLTRLEVDAGRSSQATLLGGAARTYESVYLSAGLARPDA